MHAVTRNELPPFQTAALLLDLDGTLLDLAPTPDSVVVPPGLTDALRTIKGQLNEALAVVTGRSIETIDGLLGDAPHAVAGEHGGAFRPVPGALIERPDLEPPPRNWVDTGAALEAAHPGAMFERKPRGFGLHFRLAPDAGPAIYEVLSALIGDSADFELLPGHMMWEVRPRGVDKGDAVTNIMRRAPFVGRLPVFIGDDVTDEDGMRVARALGGVGLRVQDVFGDAGGVRAWLHETASRGDWGALR
jgi:trehalose 6-phosphate phosphatase